VKKPMSFLDLNCASIQSINSNSLIINKNEGAFELKFLNEDRRDHWLSSLRNFCVFSDFDDTYSKQQMIYEGTLAKIFVIQSRNSGRLLAAKAFDKYQFTPFALKNFKEALLKQIALVQTLNPRFIIRLHGLYETEDSLYLIMDLIQGASLKEVLSTHIIDDELSEKQIKHISYSIIECAQYMASNRVKHRDLKPENILIQPNGEIKIIDLGLSTYMNLPEYLFRTCGGSFGYMAPEAFDNHEAITDGCYDHRCEVFSTGCILFEMLFGKPLFEGSNTRELIEANKDSEKLQTQISKIKKELKDKNSPINRKGMKLLLLLLEPDYKKRILATQALQHKYFDSIKIKPSFKEKITSVVSSAFSNSKLKPPTSNLYNKGLVSLKESIKLNSMSCKLGKSDIFLDSKPVSISISTSGDSPDLQPMRDPPSSSTTSTMSRSQRRTSLYYNIRNSSDGTTSSEHVPELCLNGGFFLSPERAEAPIKQDCLWVKSPEVLKLSSASPSKAQEESLGEDIEDEGCKVGFFIERIKHKEISKAETKMSRFQ